MILHLIIDEKFIDMAHDIFEQVYPYKNKYILIGNKNDKLKHIKKTPVNVVEPKLAYSKNFLKTLKEYKAVIIHWLHYTSAKLVNLSDDRIYFHWMGWGGDYYNLINIELFEPKTKSLYKKTMAESWFKNPTLNMKKLVFSEIERTEKKKALKKIKSVSFVLEEDFQIFKQFYKNLSLEHIPWNYGTIENHIYPNLELKDHGKKNWILVGNSATFENNHLDVFDFLKSHNLTFDKIICPLSYGENECKYKIAETGYKMFGEKFYPLLDFLPLTEYLKIVGKCEKAVMYHIRQQALGNILMMLFNGSQIYMNKKSPAYIFFKNKRIKLFTLEEILKQDVNLDENDIIMNREIIKKLWGTEAILNKTQILIERLINA